jgi:hypothetical protein
MAYLPITVLINQTQPNLSFKDRYYLFQAAQFMPLISIG